MRILSQLWGTISYVGAVIVAALLVSNRLPHKDKCWLKTVLASVAIVAVSYACERLVAMSGLTGYLRLTLRTMNCAVVFVCTMGLIKYTCTCSIWQALFCVTTGYCMEHISQKMYLTLLLGLPDNLGLAVTIPLTIAMRALVYVPMALILIRRANLRNIETDNKMQMIAALIIVVFAIFISAFSSTEAGNSRLLNLYLHLYSIVLCVLGLFVQFYQVSYQRMKSERDILQQLVYQEAEQYQKEKDTIDVINVKYHDLKHQLHILEERYGKDMLKDMRQAIDGYDEFFRTGNAALDTILTMKNYNCINKQIQFTCLADGEKLNLMTEADVYSLFGNILDNAIDAVEKLPFQRRIISLNVFARNDFLFIHCENYCENTPVFVDGLPQTTKVDKNYHGFGSYSLQMLAEKYNGQCTFSANNNIFYTDIVLPQQ